MSHLFHPRLPRTARIDLAWLAVVGGVFATCNAAAEPADYALDPVHTRVLFEIGHAGLSQAVGTVSGSTGTLRFDPEDWNSARIEAQVPLDRLELGDAKWNRAALANSLLDAGDHPLATFTSTRVEAIDASHARVFGALTLRGVTQETQLDVTLNALKRHPLPPFRRTVGFSATTTISRTAFGLIASPALIGDDVQLRIEAEATRMSSRKRKPDGRGADDEKGAPDAPGTPQPR